MAKNDVELSIGGDASGLTAALTDAKDATLAASAEMKSAIETVQGAFSKLQGIAIAFTAVLAGGSAFKKIIADSQEWNMKAVELSRSLGITTEQASVYMTALQHLGLNSDVLTSASVKMSKAIHTNGEAFDKLGIQTKDANGVFLSSGEVLTNVLQRLEAIHNPIERNIAGTTLLGKGWAEMLPLMRLTAQGMADAEKRARELGLIVGPEGAEMAEQYKLAMNDVKLVGTSLEIQFGKALIPTLTSLGSAFSGYGAQMGEVFANVLKGIAIVGANVWFTLEGIGKTLGAIGAAAAAMLHGDFAGAKSIMADLKTDIQGLNKQLDEFENRIMNPPAPPKSAGPDLSGQGIDELLTKSKENATKVSSKYAEDEIRNANEILDALKRTAIEEAEAHEQAKLGEIAVTEMALREQLKDGEVTAAQFLAQERALIDQRLQAQREFFAKKQGLAAGDEAEEAHLQLELTKAEAQALKDRQKAEDEAHRVQIAGWDRVFKSIESGFQRNIAQFIRGYQSLGQSLRGMLASVADTMAQTVAKNIATMATQAAAGKAIRSKEILGDAEAAAAGAYRSIVGIPYVGPFLAPAAAAVAFGAVAAFDSAEGGYDIPGSINPMVQTHANEMILPAKYADVIRGLAEGGGAGGGQVHNHNYQIVAWDGKSVDNWLRSGGGKQIAAEMSRQYNQFNPNLRKN